MRFKQLGDFSFEVLPVNDKRHKKRLQRRQLPIVNNFVRTSPSYSRNKLIEPLGIFFAAMPNKRTPRERVGK
jgi:hypothetical protein